MAGNLQQPRMKTIRTFSSPRSCSRWRTVWSKHFQSLDLSRINPWTCLVQPTNKSKRRKCRNLLITCDTQTKCRIWIWSRSNLTSIPSSSNKWPSSFSKSTESSHQLSWIKSRRRSWGKQRRNQRELSLLDLTWSSASKSLETSKRLSRNLQSDWCHLIRNQGW